MLIDSYLYGLLGDEVTNMHKSRIGKILMSDIFNFL